MKCRLCARIDSEARLINRDGMDQCRDLDDCVRFRRADYDARHGKHGLPPAGVKEEWADGRQPERQTANASAAEPELVEDLRSLDEVLAGVPRRWKYVERPAINAPGAAIAGDGSERVLPGGDSRTLDEILWGARPRPTGTLAALNEIRDSRSLDEIIAAVTRRSAPEASEKALTSAQMTRWQVLDQLMDAGVTGDILTAAVNAFSDSLQA